LPSLDHGRIVRLVIRRAIALALTLIAVGVVTLAHVTPVDPTWIGGLYDNGDGDDSVLAARSVLSEVSWIRPPEMRPAGSVTSLPVLAPAMVAEADAALRIQARAPPFA
jgi:hypothetical protein